jgi:hypothetical protein
MNEHTSNTAAASAQSPTEGLFMRYMHAYNNLCIVVCVQYAGFLSGCIATVVAFFLSWTPTECVVLFATIQCALLGFMTLCWSVYELLMCFPKLHQQAPGWDPDETISAPDPVTRRDAFLSVDHTTRPDRGHGRDDETLAQHANNEAAWDMYKNEAAGVTDWAYDSV